VLLIGVESNRSAIGAQVIAQYGASRQAQAVLGQSSFLSVNDRRLHFGLGTETEAKLEIRWPNGKVEVVERVEADQLVTIREGSGIILRRRFAKAAG
jgi:enediyne biosynthesis protein E4